MPLLWIHLLTYYLVIGNLDVRPPKNFEEPDIPWSENPMRMVVMKSVVTASNPVSHEIAIVSLPQLKEDLRNSEPKPSPFLEPEFAADWAQANNDGERLRVAIDQVASLTDNSALRLHHDVFETSTFMEQQSARYVG